MVKIFKGWTMITNKEHFYLLFKIRNYNFYVNKYKFQWLTYILHLQCLIAVAVHPQKDDSHKTEHNKTHTQEKICRQHKSDGKEKCLSSLCTKNKLTIMKIFLTYCANSTINHFWSNPPIGPRYTRISREWHSSNF